MAIQERRSFLKGAEGWGCNSRAQIVYINMNFFPLFQVEVGPPDRPSAAPPRRHKTAHELSESE